MLIATTSNRVCCLTIEGRSTLFTVASPVSFVFVAPPCSGCLLSSVDVLESALPSLIHASCSCIWVFYGLPAELSLLSCLFPCSHNTKTTSWLDPRLRDKASRALEECEDDGMLLHTNCQKKKFRCSSDLSVVIKMVNIVQINYICRIIMFCLV